MFKQSGNKVFLFCLFVLMNSANTKANVDEFFCFKAMTYNVLGIDFISEESLPFWSWNNRKPLIISLLKSSSPDLLGLQEDSTVQRDDIVVGLSGYGLVDTTLDGFSHRAILYKKAVFSLVESGEFFVKSGINRKGT